MSRRSDFIRRVSDEAEKYAQDIAEAAAAPGQVSEHDLALSVLDAGDSQDWDRLTWTADPDEYNASYGYDSEGKEFDPIPTASSLGFARFLLQRYDIIKKPL